MSPETIGLRRSDAAGAGIVLGKHSGRHALATQLEALGYDLTKEELVPLFKRFKEMAETKKSGITDDDLEALVGDVAYQAPSTWTVLDVQVTCGTMGLPTATVRLGGPAGGGGTPDPEAPPGPGGDGGSGSGGEGGGGAGGAGAPPPVLRTYVATGVGTGPVDAVYRAVDAIVARPCTLREYSVSSVTAGIDALATTRVAVSPAGADAAARAAADAARGADEVDPAKPPAGARSYAGSGADADIVVASARAYVSALNRMIDALNREGEGR